MGLEDSPNASQPMERTPVPIVRDFKLQSLNILNIDNQPFTL